MSLCDMEVKNQVRALEGYRELNKKLDSMTLLREVKKIVYTGGAIIITSDTTRQWCILVLWIYDRRNTRTYKTSGTSTCP